MLSIELFSLVSSLDSRVLSRSNICCLFVEAEVSLRMSSSSDANRNRWAIFFIECLLWPWIRNSFLRIWHGALFYTWAVRPSSYCYMKSARPHQPSRWLSIYRWLRLVEDVEWIIVEVWNVENTHLCSHTKVCYWIKGWKKASLTLVLALKEGNWYLSPCRALSSCSFRFFFWPESLIRDFLQFLFLWSSFSGMKKWSPFLPSSLGAVDDDGK